MRVEILGSEVAFITRPFVKPLQLSSGTIEVITEAQVNVIVKAGETRAMGRGSIYLSDLWAWPDASFTHDVKDSLLRQHCEHISTNLKRFCGEPAHPLELGLRLHDAFCHGDDPPPLARAMCASPFDAAIHDAAGHALGLSAFKFYEQPHPAPSADRHFGGQPGSACRAIHELFRKPPHSALDAWVIVGAKDDLARDLGPWIKERGYRCFKLKLLARSNAEDVERTVAVYRAAKAAGVPTPRLSADSNEANPDAEHVLDYLGRLRAIDRDAFGSLVYLEQPTGRDIRKHRHDWRAVTKFKPVMLDEGLTSLDLLEEAAAQGWSGLALKTCKGHSFVLSAAAWAHARGMKLSVQDLTNPGFSAIHSALLAAHLPSINGVELNSPQYTPAANASWLPRLQKLLEPRDGTHRLSDVDAIGLGSKL